MKCWRMMESDMEKADKNDKEKRILSVLSLWCLERYTDHEAITLIYKIMTEGEKEDEQR